MKNLATVDDRTNVYNKKSIMASLEEGFKVAKITGDPFSIIIFDIDDFKSINDQFGHAAGDLVLSEIPETLKGVTRQQDHIGRFGGDEFLIVLRDTSLSDACRIAERIKSKVEQRMFRHEGEEFHITVSLGVASADSSTQSAESLFKAADRANYNAKREGGNRVSLSSNTTFLIARRDLTKGLDLKGRVFMHSYDYHEDPSHRFLEVLLTAPQVVAQWINMEHYFSTVDNEVYGSGSKIYHNVMGRFGIMSGPWSDLRLGLARQTVMNGEMPFHEPMRLLTIVEAPRNGIEKLIARHDVLQHYYHNEWVHLIVLDPSDGGWYRYTPTGEWTRIVQEVSAVAS